MKVSTSIDWYACTKKEAEIPVFLLGMDKDFLQDKPMRGYQFGFKYKDGRKVSSSDIQGTYIQYSGKTLNSIAFDALSVIKHHREQGYRTSRIDLAIDAYDSGLSIDSLYKAFKFGEADTKAKNASVIENNQGGKTLYIGSRQSEMFLRIYDKAIEQGVSGDWIRVEIELKGFKAQEATNMVLGSTDISQLITSIILGYVDFPKNMHYQKIMRAKKIKVKSDKKQTNTREWLMGTVISAMVKLYTEGDTEIVPDFWDALASELKKTEIKD